MLKYFSNFLILLLILPSLVQITGPYCGNSVFASESFKDSEDELDDDGQIEIEDTDNVHSTVGEESPAPVVSEEDEEDDDSGPLRPSPDCDSLFLFVKPSGNDLPAGTIVNFLVGFTNKGSKNYSLNTLDASFRYPMDFSYHIYNFSTIRYSRIVKPKEQATLSYSFIPSETFSARPFGLTVNLHYSDNDGNHYLDAVFNETVNIIEIDEGLDGETIFLYMFLAACVVLLFILGQQLYLSYGGRRRSTRQKHADIASVKISHEVDYDWLPKATIDHFRKLERKSPRQSPRQRRITRSTGADD